MIPASLRATLASCRRPTLVCAQAGDVNSGAFDPFEEIVRLVRERSGWLHVDGAFGLWAGASAKRRHLVRGVEGAEDLRKRFGELRVARGVQRSVLHRPDDGG